MDKSQRMEKLRKSYLKYQEEVFAANPRFINSQRVLKLSKLAQQELNEMTVRQQFANYDEAVFYKEKFGLLSETAAKQENGIIADALYHKTVREILQDTFAPAQSNPQRQKAPVNTPSFGEPRPRSKSPLNDFFEQEEVKKSKAVTFNQLLAKQQTPLKYKLKSTIRSKLSAPKHPENHEELRELEQQNRRLKQEINSQRNPNSNDEERLRELRERLRELNDENRKLKTEVEKSQKSEFIVEEEYDPYNIKVRENNIVKIHNKNLYLSQRMSQFGGLSEDFNVEKRSHHVYYDKQSDRINEEFSPKLTRSYFREPQNMLNSSTSTIQTHFLNLDNSELYDDERNQLCRQKIAFFKKSMILIKTHDFDIAFKRSDFNFQMDKLRLILYVNNKSSTRQNCTIEYDYVHSDFDIIVQKSIKSVEPRSQAREQIEITLKNSSDMGSIIEAKVLVGNKLKKIVVPALFIDFDIDYKYQFQNVGYLERNLSQPLTIKPMSQYSSLDRASNVLDLIRDYEEKYPVGKLYGKSKACKSLVKLTWRKDKLRIQTCEEWRTLMGFLFLNAQETINS